MNGQNVIIAIAEPGLRSFRAAWVSVASLKANLVSFGHMRLADAPLLSKIEFNRFDSSKAVYLGAFNLARDLAVAIFDRSMAEETSALFMLRPMTCPVSIVFFACAVSIDLTPACSSSNRLIA
jgi:hypothetical protein